MKLWLISQNQNNDYDTFDSAVVCAADEDDAVSIVPDHFGHSEFGEYNMGWASSKEYVQATYIGEAGEELKRGLVLASFNAG